MSSDYCKYNPNDPTCYSFGNKYTESIRKDKPDYVKPKNPFVDTFTHTPRRKGVIELKNVTEYVTPNLTVEDFYQPFKPTNRRNITDVKTNNRRETDTRRTKRRKGVVELEQPENRIRTITKTEDKQKQFTNPNIPQMELELMRRRHNKRINAAKKRAGELLEVGTHEVIESRNQHKYGHLTEAAYKNAYEGKKKAMKQLKEGGKYIEELNDFEIIDEYSDYDYLALRDKKTGELVQAGRGSDTDFLSADKNIEQALRGKSLTGRLRRGVNDWFVNSKFMINKAHETGTYRNQERDLLGFAEAFGQDVGEVRLAGHSKAAATAEYLGKKYGNKVYSFNPAVHPINKTEQVHPNTNIEHFGEEFDPVSASRNFHEIPEYMKVHRYTTTPGTELETLGRHDHSQAIPTPERIVNGNIIVKRNTKLKNRLGLLGGAGTEVGKKIAGINNAILAVSALAIEPEYTNKNERFYRKKVMFPVDMAKGVLEFEGVSQLGMGTAARGIGRYTQGLAPGAMIGAYTDLLMLDQQDNLPLHNALAKIRHSIFGADAEPDPNASKPPKVITAFNKHFSKERYKQDQAIEHAREVYENEYDGDLDFDSFLGAYHDAEGYKLAKSIEQLGYDDSREHALSTDEMKLAEAEYNLREEVLEAVETYPLLEALLISQGFDSANGQPTFDYSLAAIEDRKRIEDQLRFGAEFDVEMQGVGNTGRLAFTEEQGVQAGQERGMLDDPSSYDQVTTTRTRERFTKNGKTYVEQP